MTVHGAATQRVRRAWELIKATFKEWQADNVPRLGAALSFYTVFSLAPLLIIVIAVAGFFLEGEAVRGQISQELKGLVGTEGAELIESMIRGANKPVTGLVASVTALVTLFIGATGVFVQLQDALNTMWGMPPPSGSGILRMIKNRFLSFVSVLGIGFLLLVSLVVNAILSGLSSYMGGGIPAEAKIAQAIHLAVSFGGITFLFALMYKLLPDVKIAWKDVWIGAVVTALLFTIGKFLIGFYLGRSGTSSVYGAAGTMVAILLWVYYAAQVFLLGAEFTYVYATRCGSRCGQPAPDKGQVRNARDESTGAAETPEQQPGRGARASRAH